MTAARRHDTDNGACRQWRIGSTKITQLVEYEMAVPRNFLLRGASDGDLAAMSWLAPDYVTAAGLLRASIHAFIVDDGVNRIIVDTCLGNDKQRAQAIWSNLNGPFLANLAASGYPAESLTHVVCTHLHIDHVGWNTRWDGTAWIPTFPNARYIVATPEWEHWRRSTEPDDVRTIADSMAPLFEYGRVDLKNWDAEICTNLCFVPSPGHTAGHASVMLSVGGESAMISGDVMHHPAQIARPAWGSPADLDPALARSSRLSILDRVADRRMTLFGTHFARRPSGHVTRTDSGHHWHAIAADRELFLDTALPKRTPAD